MSVTLPDLLVRREQLQPPILPFIGMRMLTLSAYTIRHPIAQQCTTRRRPITLGVILYVTVSFLV